MQLNPLVERAHAMAVEKGWWEDGDRPWREIFMLVVSEVAEATEEARRSRPAIYKTYHDDSGNAHYCPPGTPGFAPPSKPEGEAIELADVCIRIFDWCGRTKTNLDAALDTWDGQKIYENGMNPLETHFEIVKCLTAVDWPVFIAKAVLICFGRMRDLGLDPYEVIEIKMAYNATRPHRHGGKKY